MNSREGDDELTPDQIKVITSINRIDQSFNIICIQDCREANPNEDDDSVGYYFKGCYTSFKDKMESNQGLVVGLRIAVVVVMFLNILFSFALCMAVKS